MDGTLPDGPVVVFDGDNYYIAGVMAETLADAGRHVTYVTADDSVSALGGQHAPSAGASAAADGNGHRDRDGAEPDRASMAPRRRWNAPIPAGGPRPASGLAAVLVTTRAARRCALSPDSRRRGRRRAAAFHADADRRLRGTRHHRRRGACRAPLCMGHPRVSRREPALRIGACRRDAVGDRSSGIACGRGGLQQLHGPAQEPSGSASASDEGEAPTHA